jgi:hypothetical protein
VCFLILYSNCTGRPLLFPTAGPRLPETTAPRAPIFPLGGYRPSAFQFAAANIPSSSTPPMFQPGNDLNFIVKFVKYDMFWRTNTLRCRQFGRDHRGPPGLGRVWVPRHSRGHGYPAGRGGWLVIIHTSIACWDSADTASARSDHGGRRSDTGWCRVVVGGRRDTGGRSDTGRRRETDGRSDTGRRRDTGCCRLVAGSHDNTDSRPAQTAGGQAT